MAQQQPPVQASANDELAALRQPPVPAAANDEVALLRQRLEDETRRRQEAEQQLAALTAAPKRKKNKKKKRCILDDSDSDSDGEDGGGAARVSVSQSPPRQLVKKRRTILEDDDLFAFRRVDPDALSRRESNAFVQKVLDAHRFGFTLLDHQYEAARCVAGLPYLWPRTLVNDRADDTLEQAPLTADRHLILADQMGLGKTVTTLAGAVLRRAVAAFHSRHAPKAVLVITPNARRPLEAAQAGAQGRGHRRPARRLRRRDDCCTGAGAAGADRDRLGRGAVAHRGRRRRRPVDVCALHVRREPAVLPLLRDVRRGTRLLSEPMSCVRYNHDLYTLIRTARGDVSPLRRRRRRSVRRRRSARQSAS